VAEELSLCLPHTFRGYPTSFTPADENNHGVQTLENKDSGPVNHRVEFMSIDEFLKDYLGSGLSAPLTPADWLSFSEQKLCSIT
ncbi:hypothetical protein ABTD94_21790, partial [Acinetobacter baumannii]